MTKIAVLGTGSMGSYFAASLSQKKENDILCVVRTPEHAEEIRSNGIVVREGDGTQWHSGPVRAATDVSGESPADLVIVLVKTYATEEAVKDHLLLFGPKTLLLTLQNGFGGHESLRCVVQDVHIFLGTTAHGVNRTGEGIVVHAGTGATVVGALKGDDPAAAQAAKDLAEWFKEAGIDTSYTDDVLDAIYRKLFVNVAINGVSALNDSPNKYITANPQMKQYARSLVNEAIMIINLTGRHYDREEVWEQVEEVVELTADNICSMLADVRAGRPTEVRAINGAVVELARSMRIDAPLNRDIVQQIEYTFGR